MTIEASQFNELVSSVKNTLQSDGTLNKLKAQLRASVIKVLEPARTTAPHTRSDLGMILNDNSIEIQALHVIHECLQVLNADATLDVFLVETDYTVFISVSIYRNCLNRTTHQIQRTHFFLNYCKKEKD